MFYGDNIEWWLSRAEEIFHKNQLSEVEKIEAATVSFDGEASSMGLVSMARSSPTRENLEIIERGDDRQISAICRRELTGAYLYF